MREEHPHPQVEQVLQEAEDRNFHVDDGSTKGCFELTCRCGLDVRLVGLDLPTGRDVATDLDTWCKKRSCWDTRGRES